MRDCLWSKVRGFQGENLVRDPWLFQEYLEEATLLSGLQGRTEEAEGDHGSAYGLPTYYLLEVTRALTSTLPLARRDETAPWLLCPFLRSGGQDQDL